MNESNASDAERPDGAHVGVQPNCYRADSILDGFSCRGNDAAKIWEIIMVGEWTVGRVAIGLRRSVRYAHDLLKHLEAENRVTLGKAKRVTDRTVTVNDLSR